MKTGAEMKNKFKTLLIALMSLCMAGSMFFAACQPNNPDPGPDKGNNKPNEGDDKENPGKNPGGTENPPVIIPPEPEEGTSANPIKVYDEDGFSVKLDAGQTLYYELVLKIEASDVVSYSVTSDNEKAVFAYGELSGHEITFPGSGSSFKFSVTTSDGSAAEFDCVVELHAPLGSEYNPNTAVIYDGTESTKNEFTLDSQSATVNYIAVAETEGFYVVTAEGNLELAGGLGMTPEGGFRVVFYAKAGQRMHIGFKLAAAESDEEQPAGGTFSFTIQKQTNCGAGTKNDPYNVQAGTVYRFLIGEEDEPVYVTCKDASGEIVNCKLASMNGSATFTWDGDTELGATVNFPDRNNRYDCVGVLSSEGSPSFIVTLR